MTRDDTRPIGREEAVEICRRLKIQFRQLPAKGERISQRDLDRQKAMELVSQEMLESLRRCEALEAAIEKEP